MPQEEKVKLETHVLGVEPFTIDPQDEVQPFSNSRRPISSVAVSAPSPKIP
jgi:hypothetical protein